jgi:ribosomal protein S18 acetylase RimI-like enzyme
MAELSIRPIQPDDAEWVTQTIREHWGSSRIVTRGRIHRAEELSGFIAFIEEEPVGLLTFQIYGQECELITMNAFRKGAGIGTELLKSVRAAAQEKRCRGIWLITTNDNTAAMRFYQKKGFFFVAVHRDAVVSARKLKPEIPMVGNDGIPIRDEIELVMPL